MAWNTTAQSSTVRPMGPILSMLQLKAMAPYRLIRPNVGLKPVTPHLSHGEIMDPFVSDPMEKATHPAAVAEAGPADDPLDPPSRSHGFLVFPPYQTSPWANAPKVSLANQPGLKM